ncbi:hypothetical protein SUDANB126_03233 [Streptomyces sp. enrichment culture]
MPRAVAWPIYRPCPDARPDGRKSFSWKDYRDLIRSAHRQLGGPIVLVWDNLNTHLSAGMRRCIADRDRLTVFQLPPYAPDLNPVEASGPCCGAPPQPTGPSPT